MNTAHLSYFYAVNYAVYSQLLIRCGVKKPLLHTLYILT